MSGIQEGIRKIVAGVEEDSAALEAVREQARRIVAEESASERSRLMQQQAETNAGLAWIAILKTTIGNNFLIDKEANRQIVFGWLQPGEVLTPTWFVQVLNQNPALASSLAWEPASARDPEKKRQAAASREKQDRLAFSVFCRAHSVSEIDANFLLWRENKNATGLVAATEAELAEWAVEAEEQRQLMLLNADKQTLRRVVREESAAARQAQATKQSEIQLEAERIRDAQMGYPQLPKSVTRYQLTEGSAEYLRKMINRFGPAQITARLRERD